MALDRNLLHALRDRQKFLVLYPSVPTDMVSPYTVAVLRWYGAYFKKLPKAQKVDFSALQEMMKLRGKKDPEGTALAIQLVHELDSEEPDPEAVQAVLTQLHELDLSGKAGAIITRYNEGDEVDIAFELQNLAQDAMRKTGQASARDYEDTPIEELLTEIEHDVGLKFRRLPTLHTGVSGLLGGISVAIAARPDKGKSSFIASTVTDFAPQAFELFGPDRPILWLNNEGKGRRLVPRLYQAALNATTDELIELSNKKQLRKAYEKAIGAPFDFIRVKDMHGATIGQLERVIDAVRPSVVVADMLSNFNTGVQRGAAHEDVERMWELWRELLARHDCVGIGTIQISQEGSNMLYPPQSALKESKTGVQGAVDLIIMLGNYEHDNVELRGLSTPKNKLQRPNTPSYLKTQMVFDAPRCAFEEVS